MKEFYLSREEELAMFSQSLLPRIVPKELLIFEFSKDLETKATIPFLKQLQNKTTRAAVKIDADELISATPWAKHLLSWSGDLVVREKLKPNPAYSVDPALVRDYPFEHRSLSADRWNQILAIAGSARRLIPELILDEKNLDLLFPSLGAYTARAISLVLIDPHKLPIALAPMVREQLRLLAMTGAISTEIQFSSYHPWRQPWNARSENIFSGPKRIDIDVANTCTHNCVFCGLWSESMIELHKQKNKGKFPETLKAEFAARIDRERCLRIIESLPEGIELIQFGGKGDPFTHPDIMEFIERTRERNIPVSVLTNFAYMNREIIDKLHALSATSEAHGGGLECIVNLSAATAETYTNIRPNQSANTFKKVLSDLAYASELKNRDHFGLRLILMSVTNRLNYHETPELVALAASLGADSAWVKPVEVHGPGTLEVLIDKQDQTEYAEQMLLALFLADLLGVFLMDRSVLETIVHPNASPDYRKAAALIKARLKRSKILQAEFSRQAITSSHLDQDPFALIASLRAQREKNIHRNPALPSFAKPISLDAQTIRPKRKLKARSKQSNQETKLGVMNGEIAANFLDELSCKIAYQYLRFEVRGRVLPCCIANYGVAELQGQRLNEIWLSHSMASFRKKMNEISKTHFHRKDKEWSFCQQCCHLDLNRKFNEALGWKAP